MNDLLVFMHDTMGCLARIKGTVTILKRDDMSEEQLLFLDIIEKSELELRLKIDAYYIANKK